MPIPLSEITFTGNEIKYCNEALSAGWISGTGSYVTRFESLIAGKIKRKFVVCVSTGTAAIELALRALNIQAGDEVIVPALTFAAPGTSVLAVGATPVFVDISESSWTIDPDKIQKAITPATRAIIAVDLLGHPCDYDKLVSFGIPIIEDGAEAHGALYKGRPAGSFGIISIFSFHANKTISTGEGGCVATDDEALAAKMRLIANHGMTPDKPYFHEVLGRNFRMTNLTAAIGCAQAENWDKLVAARNSVASIYGQAFENSGIQRRVVAQWAQEACWLFTVRSSCKEEILSILKRQEIDARAIWCALPDNPVFKKFSKEDYSVAGKISKEAFWLPTSASMQSEKVKYIADSVIEALHKVKNDE